MSTIPDTTWTSITVMASPTAQGNVFGIVSRLNMATPQRPTSPLIQMAIRDQTAWKELTKLGA
jgi:hypothetical protein